MLLLRDGHPMLFLFSLPRPFHLSHCFCTAPSVGTGGLWKKQHHVQWAVRRRQGKTYQVRSRVQSTVQVADAPGTGTCGWLPITPGQRGDCDQSSETAKATQGERVLRTYSVCPQAPPWR